MTTLRASPSTRLARSLAPGSQRVRSRAAAAPAPAQQAADPLLLLQQATPVCAARAGVNEAGFRGLLASRDLSPGALVLSVPLANCLAVPKSLAGGEPLALAAAQEALAAWQEAHGQLSDALVRLILDPGVPWEAKLVAWLLQLRARARPGSLWRAYLAALPAPGEALSFACFSEQQAEQLQFGPWKSVAASMRELLARVEQATAGCCGQPARADVAWALSLVKSRTFGVQQRPCAQQQVGGSGSGGELEPGEDEAQVSLLMMPFVDLCNHSPRPNCSFGVNWATRCFELNAAAPIAAGAEVTISYGSSKSTLALLSCYGFWLPGNRGDAHLLAPVLASCLAIAGEGVRGFAPALIEAAAAAAWPSQPQQQQHQQQQQEGEAAALAGRRQAVLDALPLAPGDAALGDRATQFYLAQLMLSQLATMQRVCGSSLAQDEVTLVQLALQQQQQHASPCRDVQQAGPSDATVLQAAVGARLEFKRVLSEAASLLSAVRASLAD